MLILQLFENPIAYFMWIGAVAFSICFHEYCHASMAYRLGDDTAASLGHLSMNPAVQMGPSSLVMLFLFGIAWGSVPVNPRNLSDRRSSALVAFAGPAANLLLVLVFSGLLSLLFQIQGPSFFGTVPGRFLAVGATANGVLFLLNMLPIPMLDGWEVFSLFIPVMRSVNPMQARNMTFLLVALVFLTPLRLFILGGGEFLASFSLQAWARLFGLFF